MLRSRVLFAVLAALLLVGGICAINIARHAFAPYGPCPAGDTVTRYWWTQASWDAAQGTPGAPLPIGQSGTYYLDLGPFSRLETISCSASLTITGG